MIARAEKDCQATVTAQHWIDGHWRDSPDHRDSINPATGELIGRYALAGEDEAREAVDAALRTFHIELMCIENGKVRPEAAFEVGLAAPGLRYYGALVLTEHGRAAEWAPGQFSLLVREPIGVAGISVPWNSPVALLMRSLAPALAAGCTTVVKMPFLEYKHIVMQPGVVAPTDAARRTGGRLIHG